MIKFLIVSPWTAKQTEAAYVTETLNIKISDSNAWRKILDQNMLQCRTGNTSHVVAKELTVIISQVGKYINKRIIFTNSNKQERHQPHFNVASCLSSPTNFSHHILLDNPQT